MTYQFVQDHLLYSLSSQMEALSLSRVANMGKSKPYLFFLIPNQKSLTVPLQGHTVLLGDACHPTLPYQAQGAAMAVEDGAVLGHLLGISTRASHQPSSRDSPIGDAITVALRL